MELMGTINSFAADDELTRREVCLLALLMTSMLIAIYTAWIWNCVGLLGNSFAVLVVKE